MSNINKLHETKRALHEALVLALNNEGESYCPLYKIDFVGDIHMLYSHEQYIPVKLSTSADLVDHSVSVYVTATDPTKHQLVRELSLSESMLNLFMEYTTLLYKQAILNEQKREEYNRNSQWV